jgi:hypothetical protein
MNMTDREFLMWLHNRLTEVHGEDALMDYMHKFRAIITSIPANQITPSDGRGGNDLKALRNNLLARDTGETLKKRRLW